MKYFTLEVKNHVGILSFSRPPVNAFNEESYAEMAQMFYQIQQRNDIGCVIFYTPEKWFSVGNDVKEVAKDPSYETEQRNRRYILEAKAALMDCKVPVIAAIRGYCLGAGFAYAMACDFVIASETTKVGMPEIRVGIIGGWIVMNEIVPERTMRYLFYTGKPIGVQEIASYGGILKVVKDEDLLDEAMKIAEEIVTAPPSGVKLARKAMNIWRDRGKAEHDAFASMVSRTFFEDHFDERMEALNAFNEKRKPNYYPES